LQLHGLKDTALLPGALDRTWEWVDASWTLVTLPEAAHWAHWDAADAVTRAIEGWLDRR